MINWNKTVFVKSAAKPSDFPFDGRAHIILAGRSNVGKSSTINALCGRKNFARVSATPGKTVYINFFDVAGSFWLVDLPGYGFSKTSDAEKERFSRLIEDYFRVLSGKRAHIYLVVDSRHAPSADDCAMADFARSAGIALTVVANKTDKLKKSEFDPAIALVAQTLKITPAEAVIPFSAEKGFNRDILSGDIAKAITKGDGE